MDLKPFPRIGTVRARTDRRTVPRPLPMVSNHGLKRNSRKARKKERITVIRQQWRRGNKLFVEKAAAKLDTCFFGCNRSGTPLKTSFIVVVVNKDRGESFWDSICRTILDRVSYRCTNQLVSRFRTHSATAPTRWDQMNQNIMRGFVMNISTLVSTPSKLKQTRLEHVSCLWKLVNIGMSERSRIDTQPQQKMWCKSPGILHVKQSTLSFLLKEISSTREALFLKIKAF